MTTNPILSFELRSRWRMGRSYLLVMVVTVVLSLLVGFVYQSAVERASTGVMNPWTGQYEPATRDFSARMSQVGRDLFVALVSSNSLLWLFLSGALAASGVARERERGLLESLQLSQMSARSQVGARFAANGLMLLMLQLVTLPVYAVAFWMGGISPTEIVLGLVIVVWASMLGGALGLWFSARSHRPTGAVFGVLGALAAFSLFIYWNAVESFQYGMGLGNPWRELMLFSHPTSLFYRLSTSWYASLYYFDRSGIFLIESVLWGFLCLALLYNATRWVGRTLPPPMWQGRAPWLEKRIVAHRDRVRLQQEQARLNTSDRVQGALLADLPLDRFVHFQDPLLSREVKSRFRLRRAGFWVGLVRFGMFLFGASLWIFGVFWLTDPLSREGLAPYGLRVLLYGGVLCLSVLAATSFTRERESGTWEGLKLSLLTPREILRAKWRSPLISFFYYGAPLWILLPVGALVGDLGGFLIGLPIVLSWLFLAVALGLWVSWRVPNSTAAMTWSRGDLLVLLVALPWINGIAKVDASLAKWKYGVPVDPQEMYGLRDMQGLYPDWLIERYKADTLKSVVTPPAVMPAFPPGYPDDEDLDTWVVEQQRRGVQFVGNLWSWHPGEALNDLFYETDRKLDPNSTRGRASIYQPLYGVSESNQNSLAWSCIFPLGCTLLLMAWLRRDIRREQLNS